MLDSQFNSQLQSVAVSHTVSPTRKEQKEESKAVDESELVEDDADNEPLQFQTLTKSSRNNGLVFDEHLNMMES